LAITTPAFWAEMMIVSPSEPPGSMLAFLSFRLMFLPPFFTHKNPL